jgi:hypothetical protein
VLKQLGDGLLGYLIGFVFQAVDLHAMGQDIAILLHERHGLLQFLGLPQDDRGQFSGGGGRSRDPIHYEAGAGSIDEIEDIIQLGGQLVNVFPIEGSDECLVEFGQNGMGEFIALAFDAVNLFDLFFDIPVVGEKINQGTSPGDEVVGHRGEHREEAVIPGNEAEHFGSNKSIGVDSQLQ